MNLLSSLLNYTARQIAALRAKDTSQDGRLTTAESNISTLTSRIETAISAVTTSTEVTDIRVGDDGVTYGTAGAAVRTQFSNIKGNLNQFNIESENIFNPYTVIDGYYIASGGALTAHASSHVSDFIAVEGGKPITLDLTYVSGMTYYLATYDSSKNFIERLNAYQLSATITLNSSVAYVRVSFYNMSVPSDFMIVKGSFAPKAFIPHYFLNDAMLPILSNKVDSIVMKSPNLFDITAITKGKYQNASGSLVNEASSSISDYIPVDGGEAYTTNGDASYWYIGTYDENGTFIERLNAYQLQETITFGATVAYIRVSFYKHDFNSDFMVVKGNSLPNTYMPYGYILKDSAVSNSKDSKVVVSKLSSTSLSIQTGKGKHVLTHQTNNTKNLDTWRLTQGYVNGQTLWSDVDVECPIKEKDVSDFMGGYHGDEIMTSVAMMADGNVFDISDYTNGDVVECDNFTICVTSDIYYDGDSVNKAFTRYKRLVFERGKLQIYNTYKFIGSPSIDIDIATGTGLYPVSSSVVDGYITNVGNVYVSEATTNRDSRIDAVSFFGDGFTMNLKVLFGKGNNYYGVVYYYPDQTRYKVYFYQHYTVGSNYLTLNNGDELYSGYEIAFV